MAAPTDRFSAWLSKRLEEISPDIDVELFVSYISGILEEEDTPRDDKKESLAVFLVAVVPVCSFLEQFIIFSSPLQRPLLGLLISKQIFCRKPAVVL